jgi:hypothetical protein
MGQVISVHADIEHADRNGKLPDFRQDFSEPECQLVAYKRDSCQYDFGTGLIALGDLVRDSRESSLDGGGVEYDGGFRHEMKSFSSSIN